MIYVATTGRGLDAAEAALSDGLIVAFPTETVYGLGVRHGDEAARLRLGTIKGRPSKKPFQVLLSDVERLEALCDPIPGAARRLAAAFWPGPLTLVVTDREGEWTGFRVPDHSVPRALARRMGGELVATSANRSGRPPALDAESVVREFGEEIAVVMDGGPVSLGRDSSVVRVSRTHWTLLREGAIAHKEIAAVIGPGTKEEEPAT